MKYISHQDVKKYVIIEPVGARSEHLHCICFYQNSSLRVKQINEKQKFLSAYLASTENDLLNKVQDPNITKFITDEIMKNRKVEHLLRRVDGFIAEEFRNRNSKKVTEKIVRSVCENVKSEVKEFNLDLKQASRCLEETFVGYVHLYAVYILWQESAEKIYETKMKPINDFVLNKEKEKENFMDYSSNNRENISKAEAQSFFNYFKEFSKANVYKLKKKLILEEIREFTKYYTRTKIQL